MKIVAGLLSAVALCCFSWASWAVTHQSTAETLNIAARSALDANDLDFIAINFDHLDGYVTGANTPELQQQVRHIIGTQFQVARLIFVETTSNPAEAVDHDTLDSTTYTSAIGRDTTDDERHDAEIREAISMPPSNIDNQLCEINAATDASHSDVTSSDATSSDVANIDELASASPLDDYHDSSNDTTSLNRPTRSDEREEPELATKSLGTSTAFNSKPPTPRQATTKTVVSIFDTLFSSEGRNNVNQHAAVTNENDTASSNVSATPNPLDNPQHATPDSRPETGDSLATIADIINAAIELPAHHMAESSPPRTVGPDESAVVDDATPRFGVYLSGDPNDTLVRIVLEDGPAELAGIQVGDSLVRFGDRRINSLSDLIAAVLEKRPGDIVPVWIERAGESKRLDVTLQRSDSPLRPRIVPSHN